MLRQMSTAVIALAISGCSLIYKQPISQGNIISAYDVSQIKTGMNVKQVTNILGLPVLTNMYPENRLVYVYSLKPGHSDLQTQSAIVTFRNKRVTNVYTRSNNS